MLAKVKRLLLSCQRQGVADTLNIFYQRYRQQRFVVATKDRAVHKQLASSWHSVAVQHDLCWDPFWSQLQSRTLVFLDDVAPCDNRLLNLADRYVQDQFAVLGSKQYTLDDQMWHSDIRLKQQGGKDTSFPFLFYKDIVIQHNDAVELKKDIKVPWELSRLQQLVVLGQAYKKTDNACFADAYVRHVEHWIKHNPYLMGVNWVCPMEVGLRAINLIVAFQFFKQAENIHESFWQKLSALLYDHMHYLEHNWEWYDGRTSNHYLSDVVGYLYLCWFFQDISGIQAKVDWCYKEIIKECDKQVFNEGASYEGSTKYHVLVTELFYHAYVLGQQMKLPITDAFRQKLDRMLSFIAWCTPDKTSLIAIGDHDSGRVLYAGLSNKLIEPFINERGIKQFAQFGISIYKGDDVHVSLRHHQFNALQPSGHFHNDAGSVTLARKGIAILVDPGSYIYTASGWWRNALRSAAMHNCMSVLHHEPVPFDDRLFYLALPENDQSPYGAREENLQTAHILYERLGLKSSRDMQLNEGAIVIKDSWGKIGETMQDLQTLWNFTFAPEVDVRMQPDGSWLGVYHNQPIFMFESDLLFEKSTTWVSDAYGKKTKSMSLRSVQKLQVDVVTTHQFKFMV